MKALDPIVATKATAEQAVSLSELLTRLASKHLHAYGDPPDFLDWLRDSRHKPFITLMFAVCLSFTVYQSLAQATGWLDQQHLILWSYTAQLIIIFVAIIRNPGEQATDEAGASLTEGERQIMMPALERARRATANFLARWYSLWMAWSALYGVLLMDALALRVIPAELSKPAVVMVNNIATLLFYLMYRELSTRTVGSDSSRRDTRQLRDAGLIVCVAVAIGQHALERTLPPDAVDKLFMTFSGLGGALAMGLLVAKLASSFIGTPRTAIAVLLLYVGIQPLFSMIDRAESGLGSNEMIIGAVCLNMALYSKVLLFALVCWMVETHRLTFYMAKAREVIEQRASWQKAFVVECFGLPAQEDGGKTGTPTLQPPAKQTDSSTHESQARISDERNRT